MGGYIPLFLKSTSSFSDLVQSSHPFEAAVPLRFCLYSDPWTDVEIGKAYLRTTEQKTRSSSFRTQIQGTRVISNTFNTS